MVSTKRTPEGGTSVKMRQLEPELEVEGESTGPIRRRIKSLTIKLAPFEKSLTNEEAINVRNTIESLLQNYFFEVQPWAIKEEQEEENHPPPEGSVTYVGLAQILENKQTEDQNGAELTMNGLVYFAEGSKNIPDEIELLQTMETQALGDPDAVVEALRGYFPSQQQLVVTVETPFTNTAPTQPILEDGNSNSGATESIEGDVVLESVEETEFRPPVWSDVFGEEEQQLDLHEQGRIESPSSTNFGAVGGGVAAIIALGLLVGLFATKHRSNRKQGEVKEYLVGVSTTESDDEDDAENGMFDWKAESNTSDQKSQTLALDNNPESSPSKKVKSYLSSVFQRKSPVVEQHLDMANPASDKRSSARGFMMEGTQNNTTNSEVHMSNYEFTDDGLSDFDDVVSIQPHMVTLQSLESFEEQHTNMTGRHEFLVQKDQLGSAFEEVPTSSLGEITSSVSNTGATAASGGDLSYSSSSTSSLLQDQLLLPRKKSVTDDREVEDQREDQRIKHSMMPNPYVHNRATAHGRQKAAEAAVVDRSASCVLQSTDFTASTLAKRSRSGLSDTGSSHSSMGMIPKLAAPSWWTSQDNSKKTSVRSSAAVENAYQEDDLAYSGDEENTFGVADSDGWDPADAELSSMGDAPTQDEMKLLDFHPGVMVVTPTSSPIKKGRNQEPPGVSPVGGKYKEPPGKSRMRSTKTPSPPSSRNIEAAKSILEKVKSSSDSDENNKSIDSIQAAKSILQKMKSSPETYRHNSILIENHKLGESIAVILDSDMSAEEIMFDLNSPLEI